jgi:predicted GIY-YIG superfamily endonuclease
MEPILIKPLCYVLSLEGGNIYVGVTYNFNQRIAQHMAGTGAKWTRLHKPLEVIEIILDVTPATENEVTLRYIEEYGPARVRGGSWSSPDKPKKPSTPSVSGSRSDGSGGAA